MKDENISHVWIGLSAEKKQLPKILIPISENDDKLIVVDIGSK